MKLPDIDYRCARDLNEALQIISDASRDIRILAGGQSLLAALNFRLGDPELLVDINRIESLTGITMSGDNTVRIGALTRHSELEVSEIVRDKLPLIHTAIKHVAHPAIRNRGTIGGSIALADPAAEMPACALALNATMVCHSLQGERRIRADEFFTGLYETAARAEEIITAIDFEVGKTQTAFYELSRRFGDYAMAGVAAGGIGCTRTPSADPRIVLFGVSDRPVRARATETLLRDQPLDESVIDSAADMAADGIDMYGDVHASTAMKRHLARVVTRRALTQVLNGAANGAH